jgi:hypothetical protein
MIEHVVDAKDTHTAQASTEETNTKILFISELSLKIDGQTLVVPIDKRVIFGRDILATDEYIGIDLTAFKALEMGVSRRHADLRRVGANRLILVDLGSTNGTHVNGNHLTPFKAYALKDNDKILFGNLSLTIQLAGIALPLVNSG